MSYPLLDLRDQRHQVIPSKQASIHQEDRSAGLQQSDAQSGQRSPHESLQVDPVSAASISGIGLKHDIPIDPSGSRLLVQGVEHERIEVHALQRFWLSIRHAEAMEQFGLGPACDTWVNGQHEQAALLQAAFEALFDRNRIGDLGSSGVADGTGTSLSGVA